jgi:uncharacterized protein (DUF983 family)
MVSATITIEDALRTIAVDGEQVSELVLASWFGELITTKEGLRYKTIHNMINHGLGRVLIPVVNGMSDSLKHPALRSTLLEGDWRANVYNKDHAGRIINSTSEEQEKVRRSNAADLTTGLRYPCHVCTDGACFVNPYNGYTTCGLVWDNSTTETLTGDIAKTLHQAVNTGLTMSKKTHVLDLDYRGQVFIGKTKTLRVNSGAGKTGGFKDFATRYVSTCSACGSKSCKANNKDKPCGDKPMLYTLVWSNVSGLVQVGLDRRQDSFSDILDQLSESVGGSDKLVIRPRPFSHLDITG